MSADFSILMLHCQLNTKKLFLNSYSLMPRRLVFVFHGVVTLPVLSSNALGFISWWSQWSNVLVFSSKWTPLFILSFSFLPSSSILYGLILRLLGSLFLWFFPLPAFPRTSSTIPVFLQTTMFLMSPQLMTLPWLPTFFHIRKSQITFKMERRLEMLYSTFSFYKKETRNFEIEITEI